MCCIEAVWWSPASLLHLSKAETNTHPGLVLLRLSGNRGPMDVCKSWAELIWTQSLTKLGKCFTDFKMQIGCGGCIFQPPAL